MEYLGDTLEKIAFEKAGIIKEGVPVIIYPQAANIKNVIKEVATQKNSLVYEANENYIKKIKSNITGQWFEYLKKDVFNIEELKINLLGEYQLLNSVTALLALEIIKMKGYNINDENVKNGFLNCRFPGRFEVINKAPLIIIDGGHNIDGISNFSKTIKSYFKDEKIILFFGILKDKNPEEVIKYLLPLAKEIYTLTPNSPRALNSRELSDLIKQTYKKTTIPLESYEDILPIIKNSDKNDIFAFVGSLYMIGAVRKLLKSL